MTCISKTLKERMMIDWVEGHLRMMKLLKEFYEAMMWGDTKKALDLCEQIMIEARLTRTTIKGQRGEDV
jgi:hypothetical protein